MPHIAMLARRPRRHLLLESSFDVPLGVVTSARLIGHIAVNPGMLDVEPADSKQMERGAVAAPCPCIEHRYQKFGVIQVVDHIFHGVATVAHRILIAREPPTGIANSPS